MNKKIWTFFLCLFFLAIFSAASISIYAQSDLQKIISPFDANNKGLLKEKIFVHTDKNFYLAGEINWFKIYNTDAIFQKPVDISKVAYVEILDTANKPILQAKVALKQGEGQGSFYLPQSLVSGIYKFRAYTNWMKNFDADDYFEKRITIINLQKSTNTLTPKQISYDVQFFPEGGDMVNGLQSRIAFKAMASNGNSYAFTGYLLDGKDTLVRFAPIHAGMGDFMFTPAAGHIYKTLIKTNDGNTFIKELTGALSSGYTVQLNDETEGDISVKVQTNINNTTKNFLVVHGNLSIKFAAEGLIKNGSNIFTVKKSVLPDGVSYFTVFNEQMQPVCERLYFKKPVQHLDLDVHTDQPSYNTRNKVNIDITAENKTLNADAVTLSMSVYRLDSLQTTDENTIEHYLLLDSDVKGNIENLSWYFTATDTETRKPLDLLMLTNGWRRLKWDDIMQNKKPLLRFVPEFNGHIITGRVINPSNGLVHANLESYLSVPGSTSAFYTGESDSTGSVRFEVRNFYGSANIITQTDPLSDSNCVVEINDPFSKNFSPVSLPAFNKPLDRLHTLLDQSISMQVQNIYIREKLKQFDFPAGVDSAAYYKKPDLTYMLDDYTRFTSMEEVLREYVSFVNVVRKNGVVHFPVLNLPAKEMFTEDPMLTLDGVPVFNFNRFLEFDPLKIKSMEVITQRYILGNAMFSGIVDCKTYNPSLSNYEFGPHVLVLDYEGLQMEREFYSPSYNNTIAASTHIPDFRNVLQWDPHIKLQGNNSATLSFYTSDLPGKYVVVVQGISYNGLPGSKTITFEVK